MTDINQLDKYHYKVFFPDEVVNKLPNKHSIIELSYTQHAIIKAQRLGGLLLNRSLNLNNCVFVEAKLYKNTKKLKELLVRKPFNKSEDICMTLLTTSNFDRFIVKSIWLNNNNDMHSSLNKNNYIQQ